MSEREVKIITGRPGRPKGVTIIGGQPETGVKILSDKRPPEKEDDREIPPTTTEAEDKTAG